MKWLVALPQPWATILSEAYFLLSYLLFLALLFTISCSVTSFIGAQITFSVFVKEKTLNCRWRWL